MANVRTIGKAVVLGMAMVLTFGAMQAQAQTSAAGHFRDAVDLNPDFSNLTASAQRNGYVIMTDGRASEMHQMKQANPGLKVLLYKEFGAITNNSSSGVQTSQAQNSWYLHRQNGQTLQFDDYAGLWGANVANAGYQQKWADSVVSEMQKDGWDGVFLDDVNVTMKYHHDPSDVAEYPNDTSYQHAVQSGLSYIGDRVHAAGKLAIGNIGGWAEYTAQGVGDSWLSYLDGGMQEHWAKWSNTSGSGYADPWTWQTQLNSLKYAESHGKIFLSETNSANGDQAAARFGWASMLLGAQGRATFALHADYTHENWFPEYDYAIGEATGPESTDSSGVHRRVFSNGIVVVNPTTATHTASLGGVYSGSGLTNVSSVVLPPDSGYVLTANSSSLPPPPTYTLSASASGSGSVSGTGISCPGDCSETYNSGTSVTLTASPNSGNSFTGWGGACSGTGTCTVTMSAAKSVTAAFAGNPPTSNPPATNPHPHAKHHNKARRASRRKARARFVSSVSRVHG